MKKKVGQRTVMVVIAITVIVVGLVMYKLLFAKPDRIIVPGVGAMTQEEFDAWEKSAPDTPPWKANVDPSSGSAR